jgi:diaminohydroxyphosphoribosylaminopyrimidine deaminase/5-amino-6-(5-phosphoribosylamino)uracil reductase
VTVWRREGHGGAKRPCWDDPWATRLRGFSVSVNEKDERFLERALELAENGRGRTSPNPVVGAVIVRDGEIIGEGWHTGPGYDHAEVAAIKDAVSGHGHATSSGTSGQDEAVTRTVCGGTTMYVTLEPCCTQGRTPPCTSALIAGGFDRVVVGALDPSPAVDGKGAEILRKAGMRVDVADGLLGDRAKRQNDGLRKSTLRGLPFVTYKYAMSLDGRVATDSGDSRWISSEESRELVHRWRSWSDAVIVGAGTLAKDDPRLTVRNVTHERQPLRVALDRDLKLSQQANLVKTASEGPVLVVCGEGVDAQRRSEVEAWGVESVTVPLDGTGEPDPEKVCRLLSDREVQTALLEGGPRVAGAWWRAGLIDKVAAFVCPTMISGERPGGSLVGPGPDRVGDGKRLREVEVKQIGPDVLISGYSGGPF